MSDAFPISRRHFLTLAGGTAGAVAVSQLIAQLPPAYADELDPVPFTLGVASGEPDDQSVVLWTRLVADPLNTVDGGMPAEPVAVNFEVATDPEFRRVVQSGRRMTDPASAHSVHILVSDLAPDRWYWYRFKANGVYSRTGRTRTFPRPGANVEHMRFAFASCQSWVGGPYPAYRDMAAQELDFVVHLGDYIYETTNGSLTEFRRLHALYKTSPDLRAAHARFPFIMTWDDHEVQNNYAGDIPPNAGDGRPFLERRANGYQAYYEHLPLRPMHKPDGADMLMYRRFDFGKLAQFSVLDTRQYRSDQALGDGRKEPTGEVFDPARTMTGPDQERWLLNGLRTSDAQWNVIAQQTIMAQFDYDLGPTKIVNLDQWDGYPLARNRILNHIVKHQIGNPIVLGGDWHTHWVNDLKTDFDDPRAMVVASEFVGTSISSGASWDPDVRAGLAANPHVKFYNGSYRGYVICDVNEKRWRADLRIVLDARDAASPAYTIAAFAVRDGKPGAQRVDAGDGIVGQVTDAATGKALPNVEVIVTREDGSRLVASTTDPSGEVLAFAPPGNYTVAVNGVGYEPASRPVTVVEGTPAKLDLRLDRAATRAGTGRTVPGPQASATTSDIVLSNDLVALAVSAGTDDSQLTPVAVGKPLDMAMVGRLDQLDWINLPYASPAQPRGGNAWQQRTVRTDSIEVLSASGPAATVRATGASTTVANLSVVTTYTIRPNEPWVAAESTFTNRGTTPSTFWAGDALDHDGAGQRSGIAGHGTIEASDPADYPPTAPWIGMTGTDRQTYGLLYDEGGFGAYAAYNWVMSQRQVTLAPGETYTLRRRIAAVDSGTDADPFAVLGRL
ncbi:alkaline phosphatase D family protein [Micromonospora sp. NBC_01796]|uniref:alkaline phosphatase D family protein n=1 Tax=Micromonospora sp. NBC_01796 TaxID=2975987 RepID=UPI002DDC4127|nr:alkaline phosphatase D family protein [Micromonospora sp. NBC_01796]WSA88305.1 alkaline phosphatase D family protein [Micromonospora sp. NBC_01796]